VRLALKLFAFFVAIAVFWRVLPFFGALFSAGALGGMSAVILGIIAATIAYLLVVALLTKLAFGRVSRSIFRL
jgi:hypothetical protein